MRAGSVTAIVVLLAIVSTVRGEDGTSLCFFESYPDHTCTAWTP